MEDRLIRTAKSGSQTDPDRGTVLEVGIGIVLAIGTAGAGEVMKERCMMRKAAGGDRGVELGAVTADEAGAGALHGKGVRVRYLVKTLCHSVPHLQTHGIENIRPDSGYCFSVGNSSARHLHD